MTVAAIQSAVKLALEAPPLEAPPVDETSSTCEWVDAVRSWRPPVDLADCDRPVDFVVGGLIQAGKVGALVAAGGTGKTTLLLTLGVSIAIGQPFMDCEVTQGTFVLLSNDDPQGDLDVALARVVGAMKLNDGDIELVKCKVRVHSLQGLKGDKTFSASVGGTAAGTGLEDLIVEAVRGIHDLRLLALDTLRQFSGGSSNDEQVVKLTIGGATEVASRTGAAIVIAHHTGKMNFRDGITDMYCGSGSAAIADNARFVLLLQSTTWKDIESKVQRTGREAGDPLVLQSTRGSLLVKAPPPIFMHRDGFSVARIAGTTLSPAQVLDERDRVVLRAVRGGHQSKNSIASAIGGKKTSVLARIDDLESRGHLLNGSPNGSVARPQYVLTASGAKFLNDLG